MGNLTITSHNVLSGHEHRINDAQGLQWFASYSPDGSGFGYLNFSLPRLPGYDYKDIGMAYPVTVRKGPFKVLFDGQVVRITESGTGGSGTGSIDIWCLGWVHVATADVFNAVYCDTRYMQWVGAEEVSGSFRPDRFDWDGDDRLYFQPRKSVDFDANDYSYVRYTFQFDELALRLKASYDVALPLAWPGKMEIRDEGGSVLWSTTSTGTGSIDVTSTKADNTYFEVRFYTTSAGENTADSGTVYGKLTGVQVYSVNVDTLDAKVVADDIVAMLSVDGHGLSDSTARVLGPGLDLVPCFFDQDLTVAEALRWCVQFGDSAGAPLAWGVAFDDTRRLFLEPVDIDSIRYVVPANVQGVSVERIGDWSESAQVVYGVYYDAAGATQRTADQSDAAAIMRLGGYYRRKAVQVDSTTDAALVGNALDLWLAENANPQESGSFTVQNGVYTPEGVLVPFDEIQPGGLVQVQEWRAMEVEMSDADFRDRTTTFVLAGVRVDYDARTAELIPRASSDQFARQMAILQELSNQM